MYRDKKIGVSIPAFNEEALIGSTLRGIPDYVDRIYVCNDCSTDRTLQIIKELEKEDSRIFVIDHKKNTGVGGAILDGHRQGMIDGMDIMAVMAGDDQMDPKELHKLLDPIIDNKADYTKGNRFYWRNSLKGMGKWRIFGNSILTLLNKISSGYWNVSDPQNGYTAINREALNRIPLNSIFQGYLFENDMLVKLNAFDLRVHDIPIPARYGEERSTIRYGNFIVIGLWVMFKDFLWRMKIKYVVRSFHPLVFFYIFGALISSAGVLGGLLSLYFKFIKGLPLFQPLAISLIVFGMGIHFLFFAMYFDMSENRRIHQERD